MTDSPCTAAGQVSQGPAGAISFAQYLRQLPPRQVLERFGGPGRHGRTILSSSEINRIVREFVRPESLQAVYGTLSSGAQRVCALAYLLPTDGVPASSVAQSDGSEALASMLVHAVRDRDGVLYYCGFAELEPALRGVLAATLRAMTVRSFRCRRTWRPAAYVVNDCVLTMTLAEMGRLQTTRAGALTKSSLSLARRVLHWAKPHMRGETGPVFDMMMGYALERGLVVRSRNGWRLEREAFRAWLGQDVAALYRDIVDCATGRPGQWHWSLAGAAFGEEGLGQDTGWYSLEALTPAVSAVVRWSALLGEALGLVCTSRHGAETLVSVRSAEPPDHAGQRSGSERSVVPSVLPDFSVVLHQECSPVTLRAFAETGEVHGVDGVYRGKVTREAVADALARGVSAVELLGRLDEWSAPRNVVETVKEWVREFERLSMPGEHVIVVGDEAVARQIEAVERLGPLLKRAPAAAVFRIRPGAELEVRRVLAGLGFDPRSPAVWPELGDVTDAVVGAQGGAPNEREVVTEVGDTPQPERRTFGGGKYGSELKELPSIEMDHVIDYAILMGHRLRLAYEGSPWVPRGEYTVMPYSYTSGPEGIVEADDARTGKRKRFLRARIKAIGVLES